MNKYVKHELPQNKKYRLNLNLQTFADPNDPPTDPPQDPPADPSKSLDDVLKDKLLQSEFDKRIAKALETAKTKWDTDFESKLSAAKTEAEKLAKMNADQKADYERQQRETKLADREAEITRRELRATALEQLAEKGLPKQLADIIVYTDADSTNESITAVETAFRAAVEAGVNERLKGNPPGGGGAGGGGQANPWKKDTYNLTEQGRILREKPELAKQLKAAAGIKN